MTIAHVNGIDIYFEEHGDPLAEPLLLIMGFLTNAAAWAPQIPAFAGRFHVIAFDNRGSGRSSQPEGPYSIPQMAADAAALLDHLGIASAHVVGVSMGGMIAQELTLQDPKRVRSLVLGCTSPGGPHSFAYDRLQQLRDESRPTDMALVWTADSIKEYMLQLFTPAFLANPGPAFQSYVAGIIQHPTSLSGMLAQGEAVFAHDTYDRLPQIHAPTLVMTGAGDTFVDARNSTLIAERIAGAELVVVPGLRHGFTAEDPEAFNAPVLDFLSRHAAVAPQRRYDGA